MFVYGNVNNVEGAERVAGVLIEGNGRMAVKRVGEWRENFGRIRGNMRRKAGRKRGGKTDKIGKGGSAVPRLPKWV